MTTLHSEPYSNGYESEEDEEGVASGEGVENDQFVDDSKANCNDENEFEMEEEENNENNFDEANEDNETYEQNEIKYGH